MPALKVRFLGFEMENPTILASGMMGTSKASISLIAENGAGTVTIKSVTKEPREGHESPVLLTFETGVMNAMGYPGPGVRAAAEEFSDLSCVKAPVIASAVGTKPSDFVEVVRILNKCPFKAIEIPLSCPHTPGFGTMAGHGTPEKTFEITREVVKTTKLPVIVKLSPNVQNLGEVAKAAEKAGAKAINMGNAAGPGMVIDIKARRPILSFKVGGVSGPAIRPIAVRCVYDVYEAVNLPIIGTGGVTTGRDAVEMLMAGASAVGIGSAIYYRGIDVFRKVCSEMKEIMEKECYRNIKEMIGAAHE
jgi:dihydroorotate dehydrogenase (NAD+) catalytic subunit